MENRHLAGFINGYSTREPDVHMTQSEFKKALAEAKLEWVRELSDLTGEALVSAMGQDGDTYSEDGFGYYVYRPATDEYFEKYSGSASLEASSTKIHPDRLRWALLKRKFNSAKAE